MKKYIMMIIPIFIISCAPTVMNLDIPDLPTKEAYYYWMCENIQGKYDQELYGQQEYWATPEQTLENMAGDCEDQSILFLAIVYQQFGEKGSMIILNYNGQLHAVAVSGKIYDIALHYIGDDNHYEKPYISTISYDDVMNKAYGTH
jgi:hypothetical protein